MVESVVPPAIELRPNGPLHVTGITACVNSRGETVTRDDDIWLCRCGSSNTKPFCDGTHKKVGFSGERSSDPAKRGTKDYVGQNITIHDNRSMCAHAGYCVERSPNVFRMNTKPWIVPDADPANKTLETINLCPSGALAYTVNQVLMEHSGRPPSIHIMKNGPYIVVGSPTLLGDAQPVSKEHFTLCRCGASKNKPFCDGSHHAIAFIDEKN